MNARVVNNTVGMIPVPGCDFVNAVGASAEDAVPAAVTLASSTRAVVWTLDGGTARVWFGGADPTASVGMLLTDGASGTWSRRTAETARIVLSSGTPVLHACEMSY